MVKGQPTEISVAELRTLLDEGQPLLLLDVREQPEWDHCRIPGATLLPMSEIAERLEELPRDRPIVCQCHHGGRSAQVMHFLLSRGFEDVRNLSGGIDAWSLQIDPAVPRY